MNDLQPHAFPNSARLLTQTVALGSTEVALGSLIHGLKIPFGGHFLSLNQGLVLGFSLRGQSMRRTAVHTVNQVSLTASALKALSPMGSRLGPMLAISMQGLLYSLGVLIFGTRLAGMVAGMTLLALWGIVQPVLVAWLLFGKAFFSGLLKLWQELSGWLSISEVWLWPALGTFVALKILAGWGVAWLSWRGGEAWEARYLDRLEQMARRCPQALASGSADGSISRTPVRQAISDLAHPWFLAGALVSLVFFVGTSERGAPEVVFQVLRIFGVGMLAFWAMRAVSKEHLQRWFSRFPGVLARVEAVLRHLRSRT